MAYRVMMYLVMAYVVMAYMLEDDQVQRSWHRPVYVGHTCTSHNYIGHDYIQVLGSKADYGKIERKLRATCAEAIGVREADLRDLRIVAGSYRVVFSAKGWSKLMKDSLEDAVAISTWAITTPQPYRP